MVAARRSFTSLVHPVYNETMRRQRSMRADPPRQDGMPAADDRFRLISAPQSVMLDLISRPRTPNRENPEGIRIMPA
jgi:hypothetical protein